MSAETVSAKVQMNKVNSEQQIKDKDHGTKIVETKREVSGDDTKISNPELIRIDSTPFRSEILLSERCVNEQGGEVYDRSKLHVSDVLWSANDPEQIGVWLRVARVMEVRLEKQQIELKFWLSLVWKDVEVCKEYGAVGFQKNKKKKKLLSVNLSTENLHKVKSLPIVFFSNIVGTEVVVEESCKLASDYVGENTVYWTRLIVATFCDPISAKNFPFDYEDFIIDLRLLKDRNRYFCLFRPRMWMTNHRKLVPEGVAEQANSYISPNNSNIPEWTICSFMNLRDQWWAKFDNEELVRLPSKVNGKRGRKSTFLAYLVLKRSCRYWIQNVWCLFVVSSYFALVSFALDPSEFLNDRLNFAAAILFVQVGLKFTVTENMPKLYYLTTLDYQMYFSIFIVMMQAVIQAFAQAADPIWGISSEAFDTGLFYFWTFLITVMQVSIFAYAKYLQKKERLVKQERARLFTQFPEKEEPFVLKSVKLDFDKIFLDTYESK